MNSTVVRLSGSVLSGINYNLDPILIGPNPPLIDG